MFTNFNNELACEKIKMRRKNKQEKDKVGKNQYKNY